MVVVDRFSKYAVFVAAQGACPTKEAMKLFRNLAVKYFNLLEDIVSDRDTHFTNRFWTALFKLMGSKLWFPITNHL